MDIKDILDYNPESGLFTWKYKTAKKVVVGRVAGSKDKAGYVYMEVNGKRYAAHRLAVWWMTGEWSPEVDHINRITDDNRWCNLRACTRSENNLNKDSKGFTWSKKAGRWQAQVMLNGKHTFLGYHDTILDARAAYLRRLRDV